MKLRKDTISEHWEKVNAKKKAELLPTSWFAWYPINANKYWVWLETVKRFKAHRDSYEWEYIVKEKE